MRVITTQVYPSLDHVSGMRLVTNHIRFAVCDLGPVALKCRWLDGNDFSGPIPSELGALSLLTHLCEHPRPLLYAFSTS